MAMELVNYFLTSADELELSMHLRSIFPSLVFIDGQIWTTSAPPVAQNISDCSKNMVYFWWKDLTPSIPFKQEAADRFRGPSTVFVMPFSRCSIRDNKMMVEQIRISTDGYSPELALCIKRVFKEIIKKFGFTVLCLSSNSENIKQKESNSFLVGADAAKKSEMGLKLMVNGFTQVIPKKT